MPPSRRRPRRAAPEPPGATPRQFLRPRPRQRAAEAATAGPGAERGAGQVAARGAGQVAARGAGQVAARGTKVLARHDHLPQPSTPARWQARSEQDDAGVTGVTESVLRGGYFTHFLQLANLICAIALPSKHIPDRSARAAPRRPGPGRTAPNRPAHGRTRPPRKPTRRQVRAEDRTVRAPAGPFPACRKPPRAAFSRMPTTPAGHKKDRAGPGGVQRDRTTYPHVAGMAPVGAGARRMEL